MGVKPQQLVPAISREHQKQDVTNGSPLDDLGLNTEEGREIKTAPNAYLSPVENLSVEEKWEAKEMQE